MDEAYRIERDFLGELRIPRDALYGIATQRAVGNFRISGYRFQRPWIRALGLVKRAAAHVNRDLGLLDPPLAEAIGEAAAEVAGGTWDTEFVVDVFQTGSGTSFHMNANEVIANRAARILGKEASVHPNDHVNLGQSSNDVIPTTIHLACLLADRDRLRPALDTLHGALAERAAAFDDVLKSGRTHLMDALPVRLGQEFSGYARQVAASRERLERGAVELAELPIGGTATGTGFNTHREFGARMVSRLSAVTGLPLREPVDRFEAQGARDALVAYCGALNTLAAGLTKIADDVRWMASGPGSGLGEIRIPPLQPGSSAMPGKVNPVLPEAVMMVAARVMGNHATVTLAGSRGNFELNAMLPVMGYAAVESVLLLAGAVRAFAERCVAGITAEVRRLEEGLSRNPALATALTRVLGYAMTADIVGRAAASGRSIREELLESGLMDPGRVDALLDLHRMTEPGFPEDPAGD